MENTNINIIYAGALLLSLLMCALAKWRDWNWLHFGFNRARNQKEEFDIDIALFHFASFSVLLYVQISLEIKLFQRFAPDLTKKAFNYLPVFFGAVDQSNALPASITAFAIIIGALLLATPLLSLFISNLFVGFIIYLYKLGVDSNTVDDVDQKMLTAKQTLDQVNKIVGEVEGTVKNVDGKVEHVSASLGGINSLVSDIQSTLNEVNNWIESIKDQAASNTNKLAAIHTRIIRPDDEKLFVIKTLTKALNKLNEVKPDSTGLTIPLVISSDSQMVPQMFGIQATPFFLLAQKHWYQNYWSQEEVGNYFPEKEDDDECKRLANDLNSMLCGYIENCIKRLEENFKNLFGFSPWPSVRYSCQPRAIRLVFSNEKDLVTLATYLHPLLGAEILNPSQRTTPQIEGILNIWISDSVGRSMHLPDWKIECEDNETKALFCLPDKDWRTLLEQYLLRFGITRPDLFTHAEHFDTRFEDNDFLAVGGKLYKPGYSDKLGEPITDNKEAFTGFLSILPIILMGLNFRYVLPFVELTEFLAGQSPNNYLLYEDRLYNFQKRGILVNL